MPPYVTRVKFQIIEDGRLPTQATIYSAGFDLYARKPARLRAQGPTVKVPVGFALEIPEGFFGLIVGRSGLASKGILAHSGVIDPDYRGELNAILHNTTGDDYTVEIGDRVAQLLIVPILLCTAEVVEELTPAPSRGDQGFGSTGR